MHRAARRNIPLQHVICTLTPLRACHFCTEHSPKIRLRPFVTHLVDLCQEWMFLQRVLLQHCSPPTFKLFFVHHVMDQLVKLSLEITILPPTMRPLILSLSSTRATYTTCALYLAALPQSPIPWNERDLK